MQDLYSKVVENASDLRKHGSPFPLNAKCTTLPKQGFDCIKSLNQLAGTKFDSFMQQPCHPLTKVQQVVCEHVQNCLDENGGCPTDLDGCTALSDLTRSFCPYEGTPNHLADYDFDKIKILHSEVRPKKVVSLLPEQVRPFVTHFQHHIVRDPLQVQAELANNPDAMPSRPYWDPILQRDADKRMQLFRRMFKIGLLDLQPVILAKAGIFCVKKKTPEFIRLIIDGRQANFMHRRPPVTRLGSSSCLAELRLPSEGPTPAARECDVSDCFYQFRIDEAGAFFCVGKGISYHEWTSLGFTVDSVYDYNLGCRRPTSPDEVLFPVISAMSMGWSWALYLANETIAGIVRQSAPDVRAELRERMPCPQLDQFNTISSTYVDNVTIIGRTCQDVDQRCQQVSDAFAQLDIPVVWTQTQPASCVETVGCILDLQNGVIRNKPKRIWRTHLAGLELSRRSRVRVQHVEIWLGHMTSLFRLKPCLLSIFDKIYKFCQLRVASRVPLWPSVRREIQQACSVVWLARNDLKSSFINQVDAGDSADHGYAMMCSMTSDREIKKAIRYREKWRFIPLPEDIKEALTLEDKESLIHLLESKAGVVLSHQDISQRSEAHTVDGLGIDTEYGQWLQQVLSEGDWLRTSAIASQKRAIKRSRADIDYPALVQPIHDSMLNPSRFRLLWAKRWRDPNQHINIKEGMVALSSLKRTCRVASLAHSLKLTLCDNLAVVLAFEKGRSGSPAMNRLCRISAALQSSLGISWRLRHIESPRNVADDASRWFEKSRPAESRWIEFPPSKKPSTSILQLDRVLNRNLDKAHTAYREGWHTPPGLTRQDKAGEKPGDMQNFKKASDTQDFPKFAPPKFTNEGDHKGVWGTQGFLEIQHGDITGKRQDVAPGGSFENASSPQHSPMTDCHSMQSSGHYDHAICSDEDGQKWAVAPLMLEVFSGSGHLSNACSRKGLEVIASLDIQHGPHHDLTRRSSQQVIIQLVMLGILAYCHFGTPCTVFSTARKGLRNMLLARQRERISCELAFFTAQVCEVCMSVGTFWSIENPLSSALWELFPIKRLMMRKDVYVIDFPMCAYGMPYRKWTRIVTNIEGLCSLQRLCHHKRHKEQLAGRITIVDENGKHVSKNRTQVAGAYPDQLVNTWASLLVRHLPNRHVQEESIATARGIEQQLQKAVNHKPVQYQQILHAINKSVPKLQDHIVYGQDSAATRSQKRKRQERAKTKLHAAWTRATQTR